MVSIIPRVDLLGNTVVDWICKLSYFRLDTLPLDLKGRFYAINVFRYKGKILRQSLRSVLNGKESCAYSHVYDLLIGKHNWKILRQLNLLGIISRVLPPPPRPQFVDY